MREEKFRLRVTFCETMVTIELLPLLSPPPHPHFEIACKIILEKELNPTFKHGFFVSVHHLPFSMALKRKLGYC